MADFILTPLNQLLSKQYKSNCLIKHHMEQGSIGMLFGAPASVKSFIAMDIAFCIAAGIARLKEKGVIFEIIYQTIFDGSGKPHKRVACYKVIGGAIL